MKTINNFFETSSLWKIYILIFVIFTLISYIFLSCVFGIFLKFNDLDLGILKGSLSLSFFMTSVFTTTVYLFRKSDIFLKKTEEIEKMIDVYNTKSELQEYYKSVLLPLYNDVYSSGQRHELNRLVSMMEMKYKLLKD